MIARGQRGSGGGRCVAKASTSTNKILLLLALSVAWAFLHVVLSSVHILSNESVFSSATFKAYLSSPVPEVGNAGIHFTSTPLIVFTCRRAHYLNQTLTELLRYHPANAESKSTDAVIASPIVISQDGNDSGIAVVISSFRTAFGKLGVPLYGIVHTPASSRAENNAARQKLMKWKIPYWDLAVHYGWALEELFSGRAYLASNITAIASALERRDYQLPTSFLPERAIIMEEDVLVAPDFYSYFSSMIPILDSDSTVMAVSAFSDNGKRGIAGDSHRLVRSDFFPGLGWMLTRRAWEEIGPKWPPLFWDDWLRRPAIKRGRQFIRPEVSRTLHIGVKGGASGNIGGHHLTAMYLNNEAIQWTKQDLSYLEADAFRYMYYQRVFDAKHFSAKEALRAAKESDVRVEYTSLNEFIKLAKQFHLYDDERGGAMRGGYENIVDFRPSPPSAELGAGNLVFIAPTLTILKENYERGKQLKREDFAKDLALDKEKNLGDMFLFELPGS